MAPTLNAFDNGDVRATTIIMYSFDSLSSNSMKSKNPLSGCNEVAVCKTIDTAALNPSANQGGIAIIQIEKGKPIITKNRVDDIRLQGKVVNTLQARMGTGGGNMPLVAYPIQDGREIEKSQNGLGLGDENDPAYTIDTHATQAVGVVMPTLSATNNPSRSPQSSEVTAQISVMVEVTSVVRRLTPVECERLQGFPSEWTDGQADSHRYKQMGNAVAVPVVDWIVKRLVETQ